MQLCSKDAEQLKPHVLATKYEDIKWKKKKSKTNNVAVLRGGGRNVSPLCCLVANVLPGEFSDVVLCLRRVCVSVSEMMSCRQQSSSPAKVRAEASIWWGGRWASTWRRAALLRWTWWGTSSVGSWLLWPASLQQPPRIRASDAKCGSARKEEQGEKCFYSQVNW